MNNREKYIKASSVIEPSADFASKVLKEARRMNTEERRTYKPIYSRTRRLLPAAASLILVSALAGIAYAADIGGFRATTDSWLYGEATQIQVEQLSEYEYQITYPDGSVRGTGGAVDDGNGGIRAATPEEVIERVNNRIEVEENDAGRIMLYYHDHAEDITDKIDGNGVAKVKLRDGVLPTYITVRWNGDGSYVVDTGHFGYGDI